MARPNPIESLNPHSHKQKKESEKRFFALLEKDFFDYLFFDFCRLEEVKKFMKEFLIIAESKGKVVFDDFRVKDVLKATPTNENKSVLDSIKSILDNFDKHIAELSEKATASAMKMVDKVVSPQAKPRLNHEVKKVVKNVFRPDNALSEAKKVMNNIRSGSALSVGYVPKYAQKKMNDISSQLNSDRFKKFHQSEFHHNDHSLEDFFSLVMMYTAHNSFLDKISKLQELSLDEAEKLFHGVHEPVEDFCVGVAKGLKNMIEGVFTLGATHDHHQSASPSSPFDLNPFDITPRPR